jgi:hypothetical protein
MNLDDELRAALRREDPSPGFTQRVLAGRVVAQSQFKAAPKRMIPRMMWATALAAMLVTGVAVTSEYRQQKAERAGRDAVLALRIAAEKLNQTRDKIHRLEN